MFAVLERSFGPWRPQGGSFETSKLVDLLVALLCSFIISICSTEASKLLIVGFARWWKKWDFAAVGSRNWDKEEERKREKEKKKVAPHP